MKRVVALVGVVLLLGAGVAAVGAWRVQSYVHGPVAKGGDLAVPAGSTLRSVLKTMHERGMIDEPDWVYAYARYKGLTNIRTGDYAVGAQQSPLDVLAMLSEGKVKTETFTLAEGLNRWQVRDVLAEQKWIDAATFDRLCDDTEFLGKHQVPGPTCDGYMFPETYTFARGVPATTIFATLFSTYKKVFRESTAQGSGPMNLDERQLVTLASIVEKETGAPEERPRIACLFYNRLLDKTQKWRMETDPTVIYAATLADPNFDGNLKRYHLREMDHPYNTYKRYGLPPGPIASPGRAALQAVVQPATCKDFFFVSMNNGRHVFCPTLTCHEQAVQKWQIDFFRRRRNN